MATFRLEGVPKTDWEDIAAFELDGRTYLLVADTGDNGGLRKTLQLHVVEEPAPDRERAPEAGLVDRVPLARRRARLRGRRRWMRRAARSC